MKRELIYMDAKSNKFWNIEVEGSAHTVSYGRAGTKGQTSRKEFPTPEAATKDAEKLVRSKLKKGYTEASKDDAEGIPFAAFGHITRGEDIAENARSFVGHPVADYYRSESVSSETAFRFRSNWDEPKLIPDLNHYLATAAAPKAEALVIGAWQGDDSSTPPNQVVTALLDNRSRLASLKALYLGDITYTENEMSWIVQTNLSPLLEGFPQLELLRTRGSEDLAFTPLSHNSLRALILETGGMDRSVVHSICQCQFPHLEYLELWLGTDYYQGNVRVEDLEPILSGKQFPKLRYLGLRNSDIADELAAALVTSPVVSTIETLDLSLGTLGDKGGEALLKLKSPSLKRLTLHHHYMTAATVKQLQTLPLTVDTSNPSTIERDLDERYVAVGE